nr:asparaginase [Cellulomonas sp. HZM]
MTDVGARAVPLARVVRGGVVESVHLGHLVVLAPDGSTRLALGDPEVVVWPRSSLKPVQATGMLEAGLDVADEHLALVCASHNGEPAHLDVVRAILADAGLDESALQNTPDWPLDPDAAWSARPGGPRPLTQNCSGKHAGMLATCVAAGWSTDDYLAPGHPLQQHLRATTERLTGAPVEHVTVDGCGAPLFSSTLVGLARSFTRLDPRVVVATSGFPWFVAGTGRDATTFMQAVPGLVAKDGADGVYAAGLPDGSALAFKVLDGSSRPRPALLAAALRAAGADPGDLGRTPVLGHGVPVGAVEPTF